MAFTNTEQNMICKILKIDQDTLDEQLLFYGGRITAEKEADVRTEISRWEDGIGSKFVSVEPNTKNFGARIDPHAAKQDVRENIAALLFFTDFLSSGGATDSFETVRG